MEVDPPGANQDVTLIMPAWNPPRDWLRDAVRAALAQRGCDFELIVVDDGSEEPVEGLLEGLEGPRLKVLRIDHAGVSGARNAGIAAARGRYLRFLDADDETTPEGTARLLGLTGGRDDVIAYGATAFCDEDLRPLWTMASNVQGDAVEACLLGRFTTRPHSFLFPTAVAGKVGEWSDAVGTNEDWDFVLRALAHAPVRGTTEVVTLYRRHPSGLTADPDRGVQGATAVVDRYFERHPEQRGTRLEERARARLQAHTGRVYATHGRRREGLRLLARAARRDPGAVAVEVRQALPALKGAARRHLRRGRGVTGPAGS
jgi:O-antigen biosynthesis protein